MARDSRQRELVPPDILASLTALVVGVGAVGRQTALQLASMGIPNLILVDHDLVEEVNLGPQGYSPVDIGKSKVSATAALCAALNPECQIEMVADRFRKEIFDAAKSSAVVFSCVDSIKAREFIWKAVRDKAPFWVDGRMAAEVARVITSIDPSEDIYYEKTLFEDTEAYQGSCTAKSTIYSASLVASLMVGQLTKWMRRFPVQRDVNVNLLSMEMGCDEEK